MNLLALQSRGFRTYLAGNVFALNANWMQRVTIGWLAWELTKSAEFVGLIAFCYLGPTIISGPFFGVLADRLPLKRAAMTVQVILFLNAVLLFLTYLAGYLTPWMLAIFSVSAGVITSAYNPLRMSLVPRLVEKGATSSAIALAAINFNLARLTGPALGGALIASFGVGPCFALQVSFYIPFLLALSLLNPRDRLTAPSKEAYFRSFRAGLSYIAQSRLIGSALMITGISAFSVRGVLEILPVVADGVFSKGAAGLGMLTSAAGIGALIAGMSKAVLPGQVSGQISKGALGFALAGSLCMPVLGFVEYWGAALIIVALMGFSASQVGISMQTAIQVDLDDAYRGRVMSVWIVLGAGASATGAVLLGYGVENLGLHETFTSAGVLGFVLLILSRRRL